MSHTLLPNILHIPQFTLFLCYILKQCVMSHIFFTILSFLPICFIFPPLQSLCITKCRIFVTTCPLFIYILFSLPVYTYDFVYLFVLSLLYKLLSQFYFYFDCTSEDFSKFPPFQKLYANGEVFFIFILFRVHDNLSHIFNGLLSCISLFFLNSLPASYFSIFLFRSTFLT